MQSNAFFKLTENRTGKVIAVQNYYICETNADEVLDKINEAKEKGCTVEKITKEEHDNWVKLWGLK